MSGVHLDEALHDLDCAVDVADAEVRRDEYLRHVPPRAGNRFHHLQPRVPVGFG
jgi:hypothetical protein